MLAGFESRADLAFHDPAVAGSSSLEALATSDLVFVCVPTPGGVDGRADTSAIDKVLQALVDARMRGVVAIKSTVPPGTTDRYADAFADLDICVIPEFLRERCACADFIAPSRILVGWPPRCRHDAVMAVRRLLRSRFESIPILEVSAVEAEFVKYVTNAFFAVKVSFANECAELAAGIGMDWERARATLATDPRIGDDHLYVPGPDGMAGYGGACLPKDVVALLHLASRAGVQLPVLRSAEASNRARRPDAGRPVAAQDVIEGREPAPRRGP